MGAGRPVLSSAAKASHEINQGVFRENRVLLKYFKKLQETGGTLHLLGNVSVSEEHAKADHFQAILALAKSLGVQKIALHAILAKAGAPISPSFHSNFYLLTSSFLSQDTEDQTFHYDRTMAVGQAISTQVKPHDVLLCFNSDNASLRQIARSWRNLRHVIPL